MSSLLAAEVDDYLEPQPDLFTEPTHQEPTMPEPTPAPAPTSEEAAS
jgi:hypothetical protein